MHNRTSAAACKPTTDGLDEIGGGVLGFPLGVQLWGPFAGDQSECVDHLAGEVCGAHKTVRDSPTRIISSRDARIANRVLEATL